MSTKDGFRFSDWVGSWFGLEPKGYAREDGSRVVVDYDNNKSVIKYPNGSTKDNPLDFSFPWWVWFVVGVIATYILLQIIIKLMGKSIR